MRRIRAVLAALILTAAALLGAGAPAAPDSTSTVASAPVVIDIDLHDGMVYEDGGTYYLVGSMYACGYQWYVPSPWCGFGVSTAPTLSGPWSAPQLLFPPTEVNPYTGRTFAAECAETNGHGCFNPRLVQRHDGVWILYFNQPDARTSTTTHAYWLMGCNGPAGPCGKGAGAPYGSTYKPRLNQCAGENGDFALVPDGTSAAIICSYGGTLAVERLDWSWANGTGQGATALAGLADVEGVGAWRDTATGTWVMTYSEKCGYCTGTPTGYATAPSLTGPWTAPGNLGWSAPPGGRRDISLGCGGQARTVSVVDGVPYQGTDTWLGTRNEADADVLLSPLSYTPTAGTPGDGHRWIPPVSYPCR
ncbi:hypothetical protein QA802_30595 [Streptomyces sp. B21-105]|uniref:hypothetical protein n=1 Tax=Streptomyces sp. B21-105 TaxID=3039417 RepID=UPI002FF2C0DC